MLTWLWMLLNGFVEMRGIQYGYARRDEDMSSDVKQYSTPY